MPKRDSGPDTGKSELQNRITDAGAHEPCVVGGRGKALRASAGHVGPCHGPRRVFWRRDARDSDPRPEGVLLDQQGSLNPLRVTHCSRVVSRNKFVTRRL